MKTGPWRLPAVLTAPAAWRTAGRFAAWGPLIGGAPYVWLLFPLPFAYGIGLGPAAVAGLLFGAWVHQPGARLPTWPWRAAMGIACAGAAALLAGAVLALVGMRQPEWWALVIAAHGVPAATVLALLHRPPRPRPLTSRGRSASNGSMTCLAPAHQGP